MSQDVVVIESVENISVHNVLEPLRIAIVSADRTYEGNWWINRAIVPHSYRGNGVGSVLLQELVRVLKKRRFGFVCVAPGGYNEDKKRQINFYTKNGFILKEIIWFGEKETMYVIDLQEGEASNK